MAWDTEGTRILEAATSTFADQGSHGTTIERIAEYAGRLYDHHRQHPDGRKTSALAAGQSAGTAADDPAEDARRRAAVIEAARRLVSPPGQADQGTLPTTPAQVRS